ncbi:Mitochondrial Rho GTPase 1 [Camellia lanceoleosa]|uniref:Mitochondrial Rho GTPase 1 n=1 Tax=Camellia lanceoleosa TaxID=1840588 RepID=A0ACC0F8A8_9ERIC|nr:Mitochondrial Rho GTPase 1 [Camellia lanceoleosa]
MANSTMTSGGVNRRHRRPLHLKQIDLIVTLAADTFPTNVPPLLPPTRLPDDKYPDRIPVTIVDTSSSKDK